MPDLSNLSLPTFLSPSRCRSLKLLPPASADFLNSCPANPTKTLAPDFDCDQSHGLEAEEGCNAGGIRRLKRGLNCNTLDDSVRDLFQRKMESDVPDSCCFLPFLVGAKKMIECLACSKVVYPREEVSCSVRGCQVVYHLECVQESFGIRKGKTKFKCPQHPTGRLPLWLYHILRLKDRRPWNREQAEQDQECTYCNQRLHWRCVRCPIASHDKCAPWPDAVIHLKDQPGKAICWRHSTDWRLDKKNAVATSDIKEVFSRLPLPYIDEEFKIDLTWRELIENKLETPPYVHIRRNVYLVKKKRDDVNGDVGCLNCSSICSENCVCRVQCISCSKACGCPETCTNRPFRKEKKIRIVMTELCGWGAEAAESIKKGDFIIEYIGEVIDDAECERRLWDMKYKGVKNFYMCEIRKDFTIDATFKGNLSRFLNHSCDPNCVLEKWHVEGETRIGVFAARCIEVGETLTYDYRFVQFGPEVKCNCGASKCQGYLGDAKRKIVYKPNLCWGSKRRRSMAACLAIVAV